MSGIVNNNVCIIGKCSPGETHPTDLRLAEVLAQHFTNREFYFTPFFQKESQADQAALKSAVPNITITAPAFQYRDVPRRRTKDISSHKLTELLRRIIPIIQSGGQDHELIKSSLDDLIEASANYRLRDIWSSHITWEFLTGIYERLSPDVSFNLFTQQALHVFSSLWTALQIVPQLPACRIYQSRNHCLQSLIAVTAAFKNTGDSLIIGAGKHRAEQLPYAPQDILMKYALENADYVTVTTKEEGHRVREKYDTEIALTVFRDAAVDGQKSQEALVKPPQGPTSILWHSWEGEPPFLLNQTLALIEPKLGPVQVTVHGCEHPPELDHRLESQIQHHTSPSRHDVCIIPSQRYTGDRAVIEALLLNTPVIVSDVTPASTLRAPNFEGSPRALIMAPMDSPDFIARQIEVFASLRGRNTSPHQLAQALFSEVSMLNTYQKFYV
ncbi:MAG: DUF3492 domain-containing protein [Verrucomicrobiota bacterium]